MNQDYAKYLGCRQIVGRGTIENPVVVDNYPYGFRLRTSIRYWIESKDGKGQRSVSQTLNPKTGAWNKAKASTYSELMVLTYDPVTDYIQPVAWTVYDREEGLDQFAKMFELSDFQKRRYIGYKAAYARRAAAEEAIAKAKIAVGMGGGAV